MAGISKAFLKAEPGQLVQSEGRICKISHLISVDSVLAVNIKTNETVRLHVDALKAFDGMETNAANLKVDGYRDLALYSEDEWAEAQRRFQAIKPLLDNPIRTRADAEALASKKNIHVATLYKWLQTYQKAGHVSALVPTKRGKKTGTTHLSVEQEKIIESAIDDLYLNKQRHTAQDVVEEVQRRSRLAKIAAPHPNTIRNRIALVNPRSKLHRRGFESEARDQYAPHRGKFPGADFPLAVVQIDHTEADIILVDEEYRKPIGKPWLTLAIDVYSRMVVGIYITFEKPSAASVGMCISCAMCPKREYLAELGVSGEWPVWGVMNIIHADNAKEFRGAVLERGCEEYKMDLQWRPVKLPHYGGHIERLMGTMANEIRKMPGTTFSNPTQRKGYNSENNAAYTIKEFEAHIVDFIVNIYHQRKHSELGMPPKSQWALGVLGDEHTAGTGVMPVPEDPLRIRLDFMPFFERSVQQYGIQIDNICYYDSVLDPYICAPDSDNPKAKRTFLARRDPRDISRVYFFDAIDNRYIPLHYRNIGHPAMSAWELKEIQKILTEQGKRDIDENMIFEALGRLRARIEDAKQKSKSARRQATRIPKAPMPVTARKSEFETFSSATSDAQPQLDDDPFSQPITPFDDVSISR